MIAERQRTQRGERVHRRGFRESHQRNQASAFRNLWRAGENPLRAPRDAELDNSPTSMDARVGTDGAADCGISRPVIRGAAVIDFCDPLQKLDTAGFLP